MPKPKASATVRNILHRSLRACEAASDPTSERCGVAPEHREALRLYLTTWVEGPLRDAIAHLDGDKELGEIEFWRECR